MHWHLYFHMEDICQQKLQSIKLIIYRTDDKCTYILNINVNMQYILHVFHSVIGQFSWLWELLLCWSIYLYDNIGLLLACLPCGSTNASASPSHSHPGSLLYFLCMSVIPIFPLLNSKNFDLLVVCVPPLKGIAYISRMSTLLKHQSGSTLHQQKSTIYAVHDDALSLTITAWAENLRAIALGIPESTAPSAIPSRPTAA